MSAAKEVLNLPAKAGEVLIKGKIVQGRRFEKRWFTQVVMPAHDEFSSPQQVELRSAHSLGAVGELISVRCRLGGYLGRSYEVTDKESGEVRRIRNVNMTLELID
jgi:hypothetical protein